MDACVMGLANVQAFLFPFPKVIQPVTQVLSNTTLFTHPVIPAEMNVFCFKRFQPGKSPVFSCC